MSRHIRIALVVVPITFIAWFCWGHHLLGPAGGIVFGTLVGGIAFLNLRHFRDRRPSKISDVVVLVLSVALIAFGTWPPLINKSYYHEIAEYQGDRAIVSTVQEILASAPAFADLQMTHARRKILGIDLTGSVSSVQTITELERRLPEHADVHCYVSWKVKVRDTGDTLDESIHLKPDAPRTKMTRRTLYRTNSP